MSPTKTRAVFICQGGGKGEALHQAQLRWTAEAAGWAVHALPQACQAESAQALADIWRENGYEHAWLAACGRAAGPALGAALAGAGLDPARLDHCPSWLPGQPHLAPCEPRPQAVAELGAWLNTPAAAPPESQPWPQVRRVLVVGHGVLALEAVEDLSQAGLEVVWLSPGQRLLPREAAGGAPQPADAPERLRALGTNPGVEVVRQGSLEGLSGTVGDFRARLADRQGRHRELAVGAVLMLQGPPLALNTWPGGPGPGPRVMDLDRLALLWDAPAHREKLWGPGPLRVALAVGLGREARPAALRAALTLAGRVAAQPGGQALIITGNAKQAAPDLEILTETTLGPGVFMVKLNQDRPTVETTESGLVWRCHDPILDEEVVWPCDLAALDLAPAPDAVHAQLAARLGLAVGPGGRLQPDLVAALPVGSPRRGVVLAGPARGDDPDQGPADLGAALLEIRQLLAPEPQRAWAVPVLVDRRRCTICLTCVRVCPQGAMTWHDRRPRANPLACTGCGTCAAECPMEALQLPGQEDAAQEARVAALAGADMSTPRLLVYACGQGPGAALAAGGDADWPGEVNVVQVPCAGKVDLDYCLAAFRQGFAGVLILACHAEACQSQAGNLWAAWRRDHLRALLAETGLEPERLLWGTAAAHQPAAVRRAVAEALAQLADLGPSPLVTAAQMRRLLSRFEVTTDQTLAITG